MSDVQNAVNNVNETLNQVTVKVTDINGVETSILMPMTGTIVVVAADGKEHKFSLIKNHRAVKPIEEMDFTELKNEIRNANSVLYKSKKTAEANGKLEDVEVQARLKVMEDRLEAAKKLMTEKFPAGPKQTKANKAAAILKAIKESALPEDQKAAAIAKLEALVGLLNTAATTNKPAAEVAIEQATEGVEAPKTDKVERPRR